MRAYAVVGSVVAAVTLSACGGSGGGGTTYTTVSLTTNCDHANVSLGSSVDDIVSIDNTSGHSWKAAYAFVDRQGDFRLDAISMSNQASTDLGGNSYNLGTLASGDTGELHIHMTATKSGTAPRVTVQVWGSSSSVTSPGASLSFPDKAQTVSCDHVIQ
jgi:hypothetical protein